MRVAIAGAGNVGQAIARSVLRSGHKVLLIERQRPHYRPVQVPGADWMWADACELAALQAAGIETADVAIAATGDDKANLVFAWLGKTQFRVPHVVARVNDPNNQWLFTEWWGVDVAVSTPTSIVAGVEEALAASDVVRLMTLHHGAGNIVELALPVASHRVGRPVGELNRPSEVTVLGLVRDETLLAPVADHVLQRGDKVVLLVSPSAEAAFRAELRGLVEADGLTDR